MKQDILRRESFTKSDYSSFCLSAIKAGMTVLSAAERKFSLQTIIKALENKQNLYLFTYGSMMWNPIIQYIESSKALLKGFHRSLCIKIPIGRGTIEDPAIMLGLEKGGECEGILYQMDYKTLDTELPYIWMREMMTDVYQPQWIEVLSKHKLTQAITFIANRNSPFYVDGLSTLEVVKKIIKATGLFGSNLDYIIQLHQNLKKINIVDEKIQSIIKELEKIDPLNRCFTIE